MASNPGPKIINFLYPATLKSAGYYAIPSIQKVTFECLSVCPTAHRFHSLLGAFLTNSNSSNML